GAEGQLDERAVVERSAEPREQPVERADLTRARLAARLAFAHTPAPCRATVGAGLPSFSALRVRLPRSRRTNLRLVSCRNASIFELSRPRRKFHRMRNTRPGRVTNDVR